MRLNQWELMSALTVAVAASLLRVKGEGDALLERSNPSTLSLQDEESQRSFWDCQSFDRSQKVIFWSNIKAVNTVQNHVDWELLKDRYLLSTFDSERRLGKRKPRRRRRRKDWKVKQVEQLQVSKPGGSEQNGKNINSKQANNLYNKISETLKNSGLENIKEQVKQAEIRAENMVAENATSGGGGIEVPINNSTVSKPANDLNKLISQALDDAGLGEIKDQVKQAEIRAENNMNENVTSDDAAGVDDDVVSPADNSTATLDDDSSSNTNYSGDDNAGANDDSMINNSTGVDNSTTVGTGNNPSPNDDGIPIPSYEYLTGNCPGAGDSDAAVPCAPKNLDQLCDKYQVGSSFKLCWEACIPSFCCIHDAPPTTNEIAPNCNKDVNCAQYASCYIVWWKMHDTVGPATEVRLEQNDDFFDFSTQDLESDVNGMAFYREMLFHHFDNSTEVIRLGTVKFNDSISYFDSDLLFLNSTYWNTTI